MKTSILTRPSRRDRLFAKASVYIFRFVCMTFGLLLLSACAHDKNAKPSQRANRSAELYNKLQQEAARYIVTAQRNGKLPGVAPDESAPFEIHSQMLWDQQGRLLKEKISFPVNFDVYMTTSRNTRYKY